MFGRGRKGEVERQEPRFDSHPEELMDLRLSPHDRAGGPVHRGEVSPPPRLAKRKLDPLDAYDDDPPPLPRRGTRVEARYEDIEGEDMSRGRRSGRGGGGNGGRGGGHDRGPERGRRPKRRSLIGRLVSYTLVLGVWAFLAVAGLLVYEGTKLPPIQSLEIPPKPPAITVLSSTGSILALRGEGAGGSVKLKSLPPYLPKAFVAIEDRRFYSHFGIDPMGLARAAYSNLRSKGVVQGGSTLTQQLAKNLFLTPERSMERKVQEVILAAWLETKFTKDQILELYLNRVYFGSGAYGIEAAAQRYFSKSASQVTLAEAAILAGLVKAPSRLAPTRNKDAAQARAQVVLAAMAEEKFISEADAKRAFSGPTSVAQPRNEGSGGYVADWVVDQLEELVGKFEKDVLVETTIDPAKQAEAEQALVSGLDKDGDKLGVDQGALVSIEPGGAVRALVGGRSYAKSQFNRAVNARRQPGSSFKPFVYLTALERGWRPDMVVQDAPVNLKGWSPENFDRKYRGSVTLMQALATSLNTVAVRLGLEVGPQNVVATAHRLGISSQLQANPSIALGTSEVSLLEMAGAYAPFANGGNAVLPFVVQKVRTADGQVLYERKGNGLGQVVSQQYLGMMNAMMSETLRVGTGKKATVGEWPAAGKTGTSQDFRDAWFVGYTAELVTVVWLGNDDNSATKRASGSNLPVEIWSRYMTAAHRGHEPRDLPGIYRGPPMDELVPESAPIAQSDTAPVPPAGVPAGVPVARGTPVAQGGYLQPPPGAPPQALAQPVRNTPPRQLPQRDWRPPPEDPPEIIRAPLGFIKRLFD